MSKTILHTHSTFHFIIFSVLYDCSGVFIYTILFRSECSEQCKTKQRNIENEMKQFQRDIKMKEEQYRQLEYENQVILIHLYLLKLVFRCIVMVMGV
jgi:hypothetical protein